MDNTLNIYGLVLPGGDREAVLREMAAHLYSKKLVAENYIDLLLNREAEYPTGLPSEPIAVAIPHADRDSVYESTILVARLESEVDFHRMDMPEATVGVKLIFMLAIGCNDKQLTMLQEVMKVVQDGQLLCKLCGLNSGEEIERVLKSYFAGSGVDA
jgi:PTS system galactitol-specific IIA component